MQESVALMVANLALSAWASTAFCFWKLAGAACARAARERKTRAESFAENMMDEVGRAKVINRCEDLQKGYAGEGRSGCSSVDSRRMKTRHKHKCAGRSDVEEGRGAERAPGSDVVNKGKLFWRPRRARWGLIYVRARGACASSGAQYASAIEGASEPQG